MEEMQVAESGLVLAVELQTGLALQSIVVVLYTSGNGQFGQCTLGRSCSEAAAAISV